MQFLIMAVKRRDSSASIALPVSKRLKVPFVSAMVMRGKRIKGRRRFSRKSFVPGPNALSVFHQNRNGDINLGIASAIFTAPFTVVQLTSDLASGPNRNVRFTSFYVSFSALTVVVPGAAVGSPSCSVQLQVQTIVGQSAGGAVVGGVWVPISGWKMLEIESPMIMTAKIPSMLQYWTATNSPFTAFRLVYNTQNLGQYQMSNAFRLVVNMLVSQDGLDV